MQRLLRRLKCWLVGHVKDTETREAFAQPGKYRCLRCQRYHPVVVGRLGLKHALLLKRLGWSVDEINRLSFDPLYGDDVFRVFREIKDLCDDAGRARIQQYEDAYVSGFCAALRVRQRRRWWGIRETIAQARPSMPVDVTAAQG